MRDPNLPHSLSLPDRHLKIFIGILAASLVLGIGTGFFLASTSSKSTGIISGTKDNPGTPQVAQQDTRTFRDFAQGKISKKPESKDGDYSEGTHLLIRQGQAPVALTSSVVDLSEYEGKTVKVSGETQKAIKEGWLMDVGKVEEIK
jgi:hypothetical protein